MQRINEDIKKEEFRQVYLLYGEEAYLRKQYKNKLRDALSTQGDTMNIHYFEGKGISIPQLIDLAETLPFLAKRRVILLENSGFFKQGGDQLAEYLQSPCETAFFLFAETEVDKRSRLYKTVNKFGCCVEFAHQDESTLKKWILSLVKKEGKQITEQALSHFIAKVGTDMENIRMELEKLFCYCLKQEAIAIEDMDAVCVSRISSHIFDMVNAIADKRQKMALDLYYDLLALKEPPMRILFLIARQYNVLLQVKQLKKKGFGNKEIGEKVGLPGFIAGKYVAQAARFKETELKSAVTKCVETEEAVKTGRLQDVMGVEMLILSVL